MCVICQSLTPYKERCDYDGLEGIGDFAAFSENAGDAPASIATPYSVSVGDTFDGTLGAGDTDWIAINVVQGQTYEISLTGIGGSGIADPYMRLYDAEGDYIGYNDDGGPGLTSFANYTATYTGVLYVSAEEFNYNAGDYRVTVNAGTAYSQFTHDQIADQLTDGYWASSSRQPRKFDAQAGDTITVDITALTSDGQQLARWALEAWSTVSGLNFQEVSSASADIIFDDNQSGAFNSSTTYFSGGEWYIDQSFVNVSTSWLSSSGTTIDSYSFQTNMHEIGHALGLGHAGNYNGSADYGADNHYRNDSWQQTVMSYFDPSQNYNVLADRGYTATLMIADIIAIQNLYGTNVAANAGNTTYGFNSNVAGYLGAFFGQLTGEDAANGSIFAGNQTMYTIFDTDGSADTIDLSGSNADNRLDLTPESYSDVLGRVGNLSIARGTVIENVVTGAGDDTITGNSADNVITAGGGSDTFVMALNRAAATITEISGGYRVVSALGTDDLFGVEFIWFNDQLLDLSTISAPAVPTPGDDLLAGTSGDDSVDLLAGNDSYDGLGGNDTILGGAGDDTLKGGAGNDLLQGGLGSDSLIGGAGIDTADYSDAPSGKAGGVRVDLQYDHLNRKYATGDTFDSIENVIGSDGQDYIAGDSAANLIQGGAFVDFLVGRAGDDTLEGGIGNDILYGGIGADVLRGGPNSDRAHYGNALDGLLIDLADPSRNTGQAAGDSYDSIEEISGGQYDDTIWGDSGDNRLFGFKGNGADELHGRAGNDYLNGGAGHDTLDGGIGDDTLRGGAGSDTFVFNDGDDVVEEFNRAQSDRIALDAAALGIGGLSAAAVVATYADTSSGEVVFDFGGGNTLTLEGVTTTAGLANLIEFV